MRSDEERNELIDVTKALGIGLVIVGHRVQGLRPIIYGFHMPLFFFLSGLFFGKFLALSRYESLKRIYNKLVVPFVFFFVICVGVHIWLHGIGSVSLKSFSRWIWTGYPNPMCGAPLWFLVSLGCSQFLLRILAGEDGVVDKKWILLLGGGVIVVNFIPRVICMNYLPLMMASWPYAMICIFVGHKVESWIGVFPQLRCNLVVLFLLGVLFLSWEIMVAMKCGYSSMSSSRYIPLPFFLTAALGTMAILCFSKVLIDCLPNIVKRGFSFVGKNSLCIFAIDLAVLSLFPLTEWNGMAKAGVHLVISVALVVLLRPILRRTMILLQWR